MERFYKIVDTTSEIVALIAYRVIEAWVELSIVCTAIGTVARALGL